MSLQGALDPKTLLLVSQLLSVVALIGFVWLVVHAFKTRIWWGLAVFFLSPITATIYGIKYWREAKKPFLLYITTFVSSVAIGLYVFTAMGGMRMVQAARQVHQGIQNQTLTEDQAREFMRSNLDFMENTVESEEEREKLELMRKFIKKSEGGFTEEEQRQIRQDFKKISGQQPESSTAPKRGTVIQKGVVKVPEKAVTLQNREARSAPISTPDPGSRDSRYKAISPYEAKGYIGARVLLTGKDDAVRKGRLIGVYGDRLRFERRISGGRVTFVYRAADIKLLRVRLD